MDVFCSSSELWFEVIYSVIAMKSTELMLGNIYSTMT